jgi:hypothetical protein
VEQHESACGDCKARIEHKRSVSAGITQAINVLAKEVPHVPDLNVPEVQKNRSIALLRRALIPVAAACLVLLLFLFTIDRNGQPEVEKAPLKNWEYNANMPISNQDLIIQITDAEGKVLEISIE